jgi:hypothetical protein
MVRGTTFAHPCSARKADNHCDIVVRIERRDIPSPCVNCLSEGNGRRLKPGRPTSEMHDVIPSISSPASGKLRNDNGGMARHLEEVRPKGQSTKMALWLRGLCYLHAYFQELAYIGWWSADESCCGLKHHFYSSCKDALQATLPHAAVRIGQKHPNYKWNAIWGNISSKHLPLTVRSRWYTVTHDLTPQTNAYTQYT